MNSLDWSVLLFTLLAIVFYGVYKTRNMQQADDMLKGAQSNWWSIGLSVMATQASAITFISTPGYAFDQGIDFVANYFGMPLAIIVVAAVFIPIYHKLNVYTAYEYLESRFDLKGRLLAASLFLIQRGLAAGITIYAPAIILSTALSWDLSLTIIFVGILVIFYTVSGGTTAVNLTQKYQMSIIFIGLFIAFGIILNHLPENMGFIDALKINGTLGKLDAIKWDPTEKYSIWSGLLGGFFLSLSYFGTDQSQVSRYLSGKSLRESQLGLIFNAFVKIPMQYFILLLGLMLFTFYQFQEHPILFSGKGFQQLAQTEYGDSLLFKNAQYQVLHEEKKQLLLNTEVWDQNAKEELQQLHQSSQELRSKVVEVQSKTIGGKDSDFVFISFIMDYLPHGLIGLLLAVIISAAMSSTSGELNALSTTTTIDFVKRLKTKPIKNQVATSRWITLIWGTMAISFALLAQLVESLIEAVNILGSLFYGNVLGIFLVAFILKKVKGNAVFMAALITQIGIFFVFFYLDLPYLYLNLIGCLSTFILAYIISLINNEATPNDTLNTNISA